MDFSKNQFKSLYGREKPSVNSSLIFMCKIGVRSGWFKGQFVIETLIFIFTDVMTFSGKALELAKQLGYKK